MPPLATDLRKQLENVCVQARDLAEAAARAALKRWAVDVAEPFEHFSAADKAFRNRLRARGRQAGDRRDDSKKTQEIDRLTEELAYEYWHRMLFARFLAENDLLMHPDGVAVTLAECEELAKSEAAANGFVLAARYASRMLPEIFRTDDVLLEVEFPINDRLPLEKRLASLPVPVFTADDSLGWVYQFWQTKKKDEVNKSGQKIDGRSLPAVTQLFTEHYMVEFLLHNTIGAWWCARHGIQGPPGGAGVPEGKCPVRLDYLRWAPLPPDSVVAQPPSAGSSSASSSSSSSQPGAAVPHLPPAKPSKSESRRNMPHFQAEGKTYFVTFCTHKRWTLPEEVRPAVMQHCLYEHGRKLTMHALTVMPDHVHLLFTPRVDPSGNVYGLSEILCGIKGASAHTVNKRLGRKGHVWQDESFDHILRREESLEEKAEYIRQNPVRKEIVADPDDYPFTWIEGKASQDVAQPPSAGSESFYPFTWIEGKASQDVAQPPSAGSESFYPFTWIEGKASQDAGSESFSPAEEAQPRAAVLHVKPAAGSFEGWPETLKEFTMLDPCCGSGHFLVAGFNLLVPLRRHDEGLSAADAVDAVLRENIHGLELDPRCTQIAAFALAMAAWKFPGDDRQPLGYRPLPPLNIACSGQGVVGSKEDWVRFANGDARFREGMGRLYDLFEKAPTLGSLIDPRTVAEDLFALGFTTLKGTLDRALKKIEAQNDPDRAAVGVAAQGIALAASMMAREFTLVATNVPYLGRPDQDEILKEHCDDHFRVERADLATCFVRRCLSFAQASGSVALVTPQSWLFQGGYKKFRRQLLESTRLSFLAKLGPRAFDTIGGERVNVCLVCLTNQPPVEDQEFAGVDASEGTNASTKARLLSDVRLFPASQQSQMGNPDHRITLEIIGSGVLLSHHANCVQGLATSDDPQFTCLFWELPEIGNGWEGLMGTVEQTCNYGGRERLIHWENGEGRYFRHAQELKAEGRLGGWKSGTEARGKFGVLVSQMSSMPVTLYTGEFYDHNASVIVSDDPTKIFAIWTYASSPQFAVEVRKLDQSLKPSNNVFVKVPFNFEQWQAAAIEKYPEGLPPPNSDDPTQWLFKGHPKGSTDPLQVAVARLLGYRWPDQEPDNLDPRPKSEFCGTAALGCHDPQMNPAEGGWATGSGSGSSPPQPCGTAAPGCHDPGMNPATGSGHDLRTNPAGGGWATGSGHDLKTNPAEGGWATGSGSGSSPSQPCGTAAPGCHDPGMNPATGSGHDLGTNPAEGGWATGSGHDPQKLPAEGGWATLIDADGIVPIPAVRGESPAAERLREVLRTAFGSEWSATLETKLLSEAGAKPGTTLDDWLRNTFFEKHCSRFHNRPFIWHLWDGRKDGFACLVNYHKLDHKALETLTYSYLQDWITAQAAAAKDHQTGADLRLAAAQEMQSKLKLILAGEPPYDIFVRWKPLSEQPIGWTPDLNDGVRLNIRPFMTASLLRKNPNIKWTKDRGNEPKRDKDQFPWFWNGDTFTGERVNDRHYSVAEKQAARMRSQAETRRESRM